MKKKSSPEILKVNKVQPFTFLKEKEGKMKERLN
jgi:hypothetical protein